MGWFDWFFKNKIRKRKKLIKTISIQSSTEGSPRQIILESMLTGRAVNLTVPGTTNAFTNYESQVNETYRKYNAQADFGNQQTRAIVDLRTAFIAGEGISVSCQDDKTAKWIEEFITINKLSGFNFINAVKGSEMSGQSLFILKKFFSEQLNKEHVKSIRIPYAHTRQYKPVYYDKFIKDKVIDVMYKGEFGWESFGFRDFIYVRTGGDDNNNYGAVTRVGVVLTDLENYDRALRDIRRINHILARITPTFKTDTDAETTALKAKLTQMRWTIGKAFIGKAKLGYETPGTGAHDNLVTELVATIKTISSTTGIPVHWLGYVDLMSNRSTAQTLYDFIKNATISERTIWQEALYDLVLKAQELYIDSGFGDLSYNPDFQIRLPLISFENFLDKVKALSLAYRDDAISLDDYRNQIPGIDPLKTERAIAKRKQEEMDMMLKMGFPEKNNKSDLSDKTKQEEK